MIPYLVSVCWLQQPKTEVQHWRSASFGCIDSCHNFQPAVQLLHDITLVSLSKSKSKKFNFLSVTPRTLVLKGQKQSVLVDHREDMLILYIQKKQTKTYYKGKPVNNVQLKYTNKVHICLNINIYKIKSMYIMYTYIHIMHCKEMNGAVVVYMIKWCIISNVLFQLKNKTRTKINIF